MESQTIPPASETARDPQALIGSFASKSRESGDRLAGELLSVSHAIHGDPELRFEEKKASSLLCDLLSRHGFAVSAGIADMPTAFVAKKELGGDGPTIAVFCEYDALPGIGHACGHNIIGAAGAGAGILAAELGGAEGSSCRGTVVVVGSPGEEGGGGKVRLLGSGVLSGIDAAVMIHPAGFDAVARPNLGRVSLAVEFHGRASHAAAAPQNGHNALDAATLTLVSIGLLRQQLRSDSRVHAIVVDGGQAVNVIPEQATLKIFARSPDATYLRERLQPAVEACVTGAALATGTEARIVEDAPSYEPVESNPILCQLAGAAFRSVGREPTLDDQGDSSAGSTDMGNVSRVMPSIHPYVCVAPGLSIHTREFAAAAGSEAGDRAVLDGAAILAGTMLGLLNDPQLVEDVKAAFTGTTGG